jgi:hypothetical protein
MKGPAILALIVIVAASYWIRTSFEEAVTSITSDKTSSCLSLLGNTTSEENGRTYIVGSLRNNCDRKFSQVTVLFKPGPASVGTTVMPDAGAYAYTSDVKPGETRTFKSALPVSQDSSYRFDGFNAY